MQPKQTEMILAEMTASWPQRELTKPEVLVWRRTLASLDYEACRSVVQTLREAADWFPTHHQVVESTRALQRRWREDAEAAKHRALAEDTSEVTPPEVAKQRLAELRQQLPFLVKRA